MSPSDPVRPRPDPIAALVARFYSRGEGVASQWRLCCVCRAGVQWAKETPQPTVHHGDCPVGNLEAALRADADAPQRLLKALVIGWDSEQADEFILAIAKAREWLGLKLTDEKADEERHSFGDWLRVNQADADARPPQEWRCFHCDEVFTDKAEAQEHFGENIDDDALCRIKADEGGLAGEVRRLQAELADAYNQRNAYENDARLWHEAEADRQRRIGNIQWWQEIDSREGEKLVLQERVRELEAAAVPRRAEPPPDDDALPHVIYDGGLTDREHAISEAHRWQLAHASENTPVPSEAYNVIVDLLMLLPYAEVQAAIGKDTAGRAEPLKET